MPPFLPSHTAINPRTRAFVRIKPKDRDRMDWDSALRYGAMGFAVPLTDWEGLPGEEVAEKLPEKKGRGGRSGGGNGASGKGPRVQSRDIEDSQRVSSGQDQPQFPAMAESLPKSLKYISLSKHSRNSKHRQNLAGPDNQETPMQQQQQGLSEQKGGSRHSEHSVDRSKASLHLKKEDHVSFQDSKPPKGEYSHSRSGQRSHTGPLSRAACMQQQQQQQQRELPDQKGRSRHDSLHSVYRSKDSCRLPEESGSALRSSKGEYSSMRSTGRPDQHRQLSQKLQLRPRPMRDQAGQGGRSRHGGDTLIGRTTRRGGIVNEQEPRHSRAGQDGRGFRERVGPSLQSEGGLEGSVEGREDRRESRRERDGRSKGPEVSRR